MLQRVESIIRGWFHYFFGQRWVRFGIVGGISTAVYAGLGLACAWWNWPVLIGNAFAYILSFVVSYLGQKNWTFSSQLPHAQLLPKFAAVQGAGLLLNTAIIALLMHFGLPYMFAMPVAIVLVPVFVYVVSKLWIFRSPVTAVTPQSSATPPTCESNQQDARDINVAADSSTHSTPPLAPPGTPGYAVPLPPPPKPEP